jgi:hypothetical protein
MPKEKCFALRGVIVENHSTPSETIMPAKIFRFALAVFSCPGRQLRAINGGLFGSVPAARVFVSGGKIFLFRPANHLALSGPPFLFLAQKQTVQPIINP